MSWPPNKSSNFMINGSGSGAQTTIQWGTDGLYLSAIVKSMRRQDMAEEVLVPNGTGLTAHQVLLVDGIEVELTVIWDISNAAGPAIPLSIGATPTITDPKTGSETSFIVVSNPINLNRKEPGEFTFTAKYFTTAGVPGQ